MNKQLFIPCSMHGKIVQFIIICLIVSTSTAYAFEVIGKPSKPMQPMKKPENHAVGSKFIYQDNRDNKATKHHELLSRDEVGIATWKQNNGCSYSRTIWFQPSQTWDSCGANGKSSGSQTSKLKGEIWPLTKGKKFSFNVKNGRNSKGDTWSNYVKCKAKKEVRIKTAAGEFDAYKVVCNGKWTTTTRYMSPETQGSVAYRRVHKKRGEEENTEWLRWE